MSYRVSWEMQGFIGYTALHIGKMETVYQINTYVLWNLKLLAWQVTIGLTDHKQLIALLYSVVQLLSSRQKGQKFG